MGELIGLIIFGAVIGALARLVMKGEQPMGVVATIVLGALGALVGYYVSNLLGVRETAGIDVIRWLISIGASVLFITIYLAVANRPKGVAK